MRRNNKNLWIGSALLVAVALGVWLWRAAASRPNYPEINSPRPVAGKAEAAILVEEFSDFQCPACQAAQPTVKDMLQTLGDRIAFRYKHFPLLTIHPQAFRAALASECANDQGKFWDYHDKLFEKQPAFSRDELVGYAGELGLDTGSFAACLDSRAKSGVVREDMREAESRGVNSTPSFFVNGEPVQDWSKIKDVIQGKLIGG